MKLSQEIKRKRNKQVDKMLGNLGIKVIKMSSEEAKEEILKGKTGFYFINGILVIVKNQQF